MFENKRLEAVIVGFLALSVAYLGVRTIHEWENVKARKWDVARSVQVRAEYAQANTKGE